MRKLSNKTDWQGHLIDFFKFVLAVSLGFFVDNFRETYMERQRATELCVDLKQDFIEDTIYLNQLIAERSVKSSHMDSLRFVMQYELAEVDMVSLYRHSAYVASSPIYKSNNSTFQQMTNAGYLSYFSKDIEKILTQYDVMSKEAKDLMSLETESITRKIYPFQQQIFHIEHFEDLKARSNISEKLVVGAWDANIRRVYMNYIFEMDLSSKQLATSYQLLLGKARLVINVLNEQYP